MKIAIVSKADAAGGGASRVAEELGRHLRSADVEAVHFAAWGSRFDADLRPIYGGLAARKATLLAHKTSRKIGFGESVPFELPAALLALRGFDLVHFHDTSSTFSPVTLLAASRMMPLVWTFHDCSPFTGGCIYPQMVGCERYKTGCGKCPMTGEWPLDGKLDFTSLSLSLRRRLHRRPNVHSVVPSAWMRDVAWASGSLVREPTIISNMVDSQALRPVEDRAGLRRRLGIEEDRLVLIASSGNVDDPRKGIRDSLSAASGLSHANPLVILLGAPDRRVHEQSRGVEFLSTGYVSDRRELCEWLTAADAFLFTSKADNQPLSILESFACGTPVYGWPTGGASEMVEDGVDGRLVAGRDPAALAAVISEDWRTGRMAAMRAAARQTAVSKFGSASFVADHLALYQKALGDRLEHETYQ
jgi:glycosyltransferase involved in cell wall biosynthesis